MAEVISMQNEDVRVDVGWMWGGCGVEISREIF